jgi:hypothetical protein
MFSRGLALFIREISIAMVSINHHHLTPSNTIF